MPLLWDNPNPTEEVAGVVVARIIVVVVVVIVIATAEIIIIKIKIKYKILKIITIILLAI